MPLLEGDRRVGSGCIFWLADQVVLVRGGRVERQAPAREFFDDAAFLTSRDVSPPQVTQLFERLRARGIYRGAFPLTGR